MEPRKRTHLVNSLMEEAHRMLGVLEKAKEGQRMEESHPNLHGTHHPQGAYCLQDEQTSWEKVLRDLKDIQTELDQISNLNGTEESG